MILTPVVLRGKIVKGIQDRVKTRKCSWAERLVVPRRFEYVLSRENGRHEVKGKDEKNVDERKNHAGLKQCRGMVQFETGK